MGEKRDLLWAVLRVVASVVTIPLLPFSWLGKQNVTIVKVRGIPVILTGSFLNFILILTLLGLIAYLPAEEGQIWNAIFSALPIHLLIAYFCVVLHEFGHSLTGQYFGYNVPKILLVPFSGLAMIEGDWHTNWRHEFYITVFGPLVNVVLMLVTWPFLQYGNEWVLWFFQINQILLLFNLLPCFPMDGGRIVRSLITRFNGGDWWTATIWGHRVSMATACVAVPLLWMYWNPIAAILITVMAFVFGSAERSRLKTEHLKEKHEGLIKGHQEEAEAAKAAIDKLVQDQFSDDPDKAALLRKQLLFTHDFIERLGMALISSMTKEAIKRDEGFDKTKFKIKLSLLMKELMALSQKERDMYSQLHNDMKDIDSEAGKDAFSEFVLNRLQARLTVKNIH